MTTDTKSMHTPGPWEVQWPEADHKWTRLHIGQQGSPNFIATAACPGYFNDPTCEADARLIAAAPELLEALEALASLEVRGHSLLARLQFSDEGRAVSAKVCEAIAKARGHDTATAA